MMSLDDSIPNIPSRPCPRCPHRLSDLASHEEQSEIPEVSEVNEVSEIYEPSKRTETSEVPKSTRPAELPRRKSVRFEVGPTSTESTPRSIDKASSDAQDTAKAASPAQKTFDAMYEEFCQAAALMEREEAEEEASMANEERKTSILTREDLEFINEALRQADARRELKREKENKNKNKNMNMKAAPPSYGEMKEDMSLEQLQLEEKGEYVAAESPGPKEKKVVTPRRGILTKGRSNSDVKKRVRFHESSKPDASEIQMAEVPRAGKEDLRAYVVKMSEEPKEVVEVGGNQVILFRDEGEEGDKDV